MIVKDQQFAKMQEVFKHLEKYIGQEIEVIYSNNGYFHEKGVLMALIPFNSIIIKVDNKYQKEIKFLSENVVIWQILKEEVLLYDNKENVLDYQTGKMTRKDLKDETFGIEYTYLKEKLRHDE